MKLHRIDLEEDEGNIKSYLESLGGILKALSLMPEVIERHYFLVWSIGGENDLKWMVDITYRY